MHHEISRSRLKAKGSISREAYTIRLRLGVMLVSENGVKIEIVTRRRSQCARA
jgi:hypothetical protein